MTTDVQPREGTGWTTGLGTIFRHESRIWWSGRRWWLQTILWTGILVGMMAALLWVASEANESGLRLEEPAVTVSDVFPQYLGLALVLSTIGVVVLTQGAMLDDRRTGTLEWVLSKPVSRAGMVLAKFAAHAVPVLIVFVLVPWSLLYGLLSRELGEPWPLGEYLTVVALVGLVLVFTVALTMLLGTWSTSRAVVVGIPIGLAFLYDAVHLIVDDLTGRLPFPWELSTLATQASAGEALTSAIPIVATVAWIGIALGATIWRFEREEVG